MLPSETDFVLFQKLQFIKQQADYLESILGADRYRQTELVHLHHVNVAKEIKYMLQDAASLLDRFYEVSTEIEVDLVVHHTPSKLPQGRPIALVSKNQSRKPSQSPVASPAKPDEEE